MMGHRRRIAQLLEAWSAPEVHEGLLGSTVQGEADEAANEERAED